MPVAVIESFIRSRKYNATNENNQLVLIPNSEILLPEDAPVRVTSAQLEELDYRKLYEAYSSEGRISVTDPRVLFKVMVYGYRSTQPGSWKRLANIA